MRILLVEDDYKIARAIKRGLEQERFAVDVEYDGASGQAAAENLPYDLIILDRMLPEKDGLSICQDLRSKSIHTPIIMLTAKGALRDKVDGLNAGADDYLPKPFSFEELLARVRALLRRPKQTLDQNIKIADLTVDPVRFHVERSGKVINLSAKEFALLDYLIRNQKTVISKDTIIEHVWNFDADILPNTVEVYIGYLRNKIDKPFSKPLLHTVRGFGYVLEERP